MGLFDVVDDAKSIEDKDFRNLPSNVCPSCRAEGEETDYWYWRCRNSKCDILTYIPTDYSVNMSRD